MSDSKLIEEMYRERFSSHRHESFYGNSGYSNFGYWYADTKDGAEAGDNLVDKLVELLPRKQGTVLDVACGQGGTTRRLGEHFSPQSVTAINISESQLAQARKNAPQSTFLCMDAVDLQFEPDSFDNVFCVEAAFHFNTRERFLGEVYRVLKPGGYLALTDVLIRPFPSALAQRFVPEFKTIPEENFIDKTTYEQLLERSGFQQVTMINALQKTFVPYCRPFLRHAAMQYLNPRLWPGILWKEYALPLVMTWQYFVRRNITDYLLVAAQKPPA